MNVATFVLVGAGTLIALAGLYYTARSNTLSAREKAIAAIREPLDREITRLTSRNERLEVRIDQLEDELRRRR